jgi:biogenesis of lysosome-related organelles complex 1 subunit KXD1
MAATASRHYSSYATPQKILPITMPSKAPAYHYPNSRIAASPPEMSDSSTYGASRASGRSYSARSSDYAASQSSDYDSYNSQSGVDVVDMLSERMNTAFDPIRMDKSLARQTQT